MMRKTLGRPPRTKAGRKLRRYFMAVLFASIMSRKLQELRWGQYVETGDFLLLTSTSRELPSSYFDSLGSCPLPPGWISGVLPQNVKRQIITFAKNKLVVLLTPIAKRRAHTSHCKMLKAALSLEAPPPTEAIIRKSSPMFETWSSAAVDELIKCGKKVAYRQGMWILPSTKDSFWNVNGFLVLHGIVGEATLKGLASGGSAMEGSGVEKAREYVFPAVVAETRYVLSTPTNVGYIAKTNCLLMEFDYRDIARIGELFNVAASKEKYKKFISTGRSLQVTQSFHVRGDMLLKIPFFSRFSEVDLQLIAQCAKPRVAFEGDTVIAAGSLVPELLIVCRGSISVSLDEQLSTLSSFDTFGSDFLVFEDRCPFSLKATTATEYWIITDNALHGVMKNTLQRKQVVEAAALVRERMMLLMKDCKAIREQLSTVPHFRGLCNTTTPESKMFWKLLVAAATPLVFKPGDRIVSTGEEMSSLFFVQAGRMHKLAVTAGGEAVDDEASRRTAPCLLGENFLQRGKWSCSLTASRVCETWVITRQEAWKVIRSDGGVMSLVRQAISTAPDAVSVNHMGQRQSVVAAHFVQRSEAVSTVEGSGYKPCQSSAKRAAVRATRKAEQDLKDAKELEDEEKLLMQRRRRLAPNIQDRVPFIQYEGLHPVRPAAKEAYEAVRRLDRGPPKPAIPVASSPTAKDNPPPSQPSASSTPAPPPGGRRPSTARILAVNRQVAEKKSVHEQLHQELEDQVARIRRRQTAASTPLVNGGSITTNSSNPSVPTVSPRRSVVLPDKPTASRAEKSILKRILADHDVAIRDKRAQALRACDFSSIQSQNPFSSIEQSVAMQKLSPTGDLFLQVQGSKKTKTFDAKKYNYHAPTSYLSAHAFSEI